MFIAFWIFSFLKFLPFVHFLSELICRPSLHSLHINLLLISKKKKKFANIFFHSSSSDLSLNFPFCSIWSICLFSEDCLYYYGFVVCFDIWVGKFPFLLFCLFLNSYLAICKSLFFYTCIEYLRKNLTGILVESASKLYINLGKQAIFIILNCLCKNMKFIDVIICIFY